MNEKLKIEKKNMGLMDMVSVKDFILNVFKRCLFEDNSIYVL